MKFALTINNMKGGGAERVAQSLILQLKEMGLRVYLITIDHGSDVYEVPEEVIRIRLISGRFSKGVFKIVLLPVIAMELRLRLWRLGVDYHISFLVRANLINCLAGIGSGRRVIISERNVSYFQYIKPSIKNFFMKLLIKKLYNKADQIVAISNGVKESLIKDFKIRSDITTIYNPLMKISSNDDVMVSSTTSNLKIVTCGRLVDAKDHVSMLEGFRLYKEDNPLSTLIILGEGPLRSKLEWKIEELNLVGSVFLKGFVPDPVEYFKIADVFLFTSIFEGFGNVLVEAMAAGLPVISTNCRSGPSEILLNGRAGILIEVGDIHAIPRELTKLHDPSVRKEYCLKALQRAQDFSADKITLEYLRAMGADPAAFEISTATDIEGIQY